jgi:fructose/tagatose bisphosphate aldolase
MPLITKRKQVLDVFREARNRTWVIPAFGTENLTTTEAVLSGALEHAATIGCPDLPVMLAVTNEYPERTQTAFYTHTRNWRIGLDLFLANVEVLTRPTSPFGKLRVLIHLDHIQHDLDRELWQGDLSRFSSIMFDASRLSPEENRAATRKFVEDRGSEIVIEGACDEVCSWENTLTTVADARRFASETGVDWVVPNLGTEHRAGRSATRYARERAQAISTVIGHRLVLHGTSSVISEQLPGLFDDGVLKVNLWTALERDASGPLLQEMIRHAAKAGGTALARELAKDGLLGKKADLESKASLSHFTTTYRQGVVFEEMKRMVREYFHIWYPKKPRP